MGDRLEAVEDICKALIKGKKAEARRIARSRYPFERFERHVRQGTILQAMRIFVRDGFVDRYSGKRLVFPGILRYLSRELPEEFPFQKNWKMTETHMCYWELFPTLDHVVPLARGGADNDSNLVTTSMQRNAAKANWTLEELGWSLQPPGDFGEWDGLTGLFLKIAEEDRSVIADPYIKRWHGAATKTLRP